MLTLSIREKQIRSKILNRKPQCQVKKSKSESEKKLFMEKVAQKTSVTDTEERISKILKANKQIHPFLQYQPVIETTPLSIGSINIDTCDKEDITEIHTEQNATNLISLKYKKVTNTLPEFLAKKKSDIKQKNKFLSILITSHLQMLDAVAKLQSIETPIIHFNINEQTTLYDIINATPVLSDFRMAITSTDVETDEIFNNLIPQYEDYEPWPIEIFILSHLLNSERSDFNIEDIIKKFTSSHFFTSQTQQNPEKLQEFENMLKEIYTNVNTTDKEQHIKELKKTALTWDVYSIAILFVTLLRNLQIDIENYEFMKQYMNILNETIFSDPITRPSIKTIVEKIKTIFSSISKDIYQSFLNSLLQREPNPTKEEDNAQLKEELQEDVQELP